MIATPAYGEIFFTSYVESLFRLTRAMDNRKWPSEFSSVTYSDIAESRNLLLTNWYDKTDASHLLFIDADMGFEPQLIFDMVLFDKPVVGVIYPKRQIDLDRLAQLASGGQPAKNAKANSHDFVVRRPDRGAARNGFIQVEGCGTGIFLIQRSCIDVMLEKMPEIIDTGPNKTLGDGLGPKGINRIIHAFDFITIDGLRLTEDYSFCHRWRHQCGGEIWANIAHEIVHVGVHRFKASYSDASGPRVRVVRTSLPKIRRVFTAGQTLSPDSDQQPDKAVPHDLDDASTNKRQKTPQ